jgi:hypothetical protein
MDTLDLKELEDLAEDKHADLQEPVKKAAESPADPAGKDNTDDTKPSEGTPTQDATTINSETKSTNFLNRDSLAAS